ncbi:MAG: hypothetical protein AAF266_13985, partial [Planctomycetota bacterium]
MPRPATVIGFDTETEPLATGNVAPKLVCSSFVWGEDEHLAARDLYLRTDGKVKIHTAQNAAADLIVSFLDQIDESDNESLVLQNAAFDLAVVCRELPDRTPQVFRLLQDGKIHDTKIRERLLALADTGDIEFVELPSGGVKRRGYSLADLAFDYLGLDLSANKNNDDAWRTNYAVLADVPIKDWPQEAIEYAINDARYVVDIYEKQEVARQQLHERIGVDALLTESFHVCADFALYLMGAHGMAVDHETRQKVIDKMERELAPEKLSLLVQTGILEPAQPPRPHARGAKNHVEGCDKKDCDCPVKMTAGKKEKKNTKKLFAYVEEMKERLGDRVELRRTSPSSKFPDGQLCVDSEWRDDHKHLDPVIEQLDHRESLQKLVTTELPRMIDPTTEAPADVVHPCYDVLKSTGRTSSFASKLYASFNTQNLHPDIRKCYVPRDGRVFFGIDFSQMELGTLAQTCLNLFGHSVLAEKINAGVDPHAYLGAQIAYRLDDDFRACCDAEGVSGKEDVYREFCGLATCGFDELVKMYAHFRKFAKPTGLGYPGGLGPATFIKYAKATFGVECDLETAEALREVWFETFDEMPDYFAHIRGLVDPHNDPKTHTKPDGTERISDRYAYFSPLGMYRAGCDYCAAANGQGLQTPAAEGAKLAVYNVVRACYDSEAGEPLLYGKAWPIAFVHDEIIGEIEEDDM